MKLLRLTTAYERYLLDFYGRRPELRDAPYECQLREMHLDAFGWADFWQHALAPLGWQVTDITANAEPLQKSWARDCGFTPQGSNWLLEIAFEQVRRFAPDVLFMDDYSNFPAAWIRQLRDTCPSIRLVLGWCGAPYDDEDIFRAYDLVLSCIPELLEQFREKGHTTYHLNHAFDARLAERITVGPRDIDLSFIGTVGTGGRAHTRRFELLSQLSKETGMQIYAPETRNISTLRWARYVAFWVAHKHGIPVQKIPFVRERIVGKKEPASISISDVLKVPRSPIQGMRPPVFGMDMYRVLARSKISLNSHTDISPRSASNMRMFEATGMGACLLTDWRSNLRELFEPDVELVTYRSAAECVDKVNWLLGHPEEITRIAEAGRRRTLRSHTYNHRAPLLDEIMRNHMR
jgi:spore maturation protein CgeB